MDGFAEYLRGAIRRRSADVRDERVGSSRSSPSVQTMGAGLQIASPRLESAAIAVGRLNLHFAWGDRSETRQIRAARRCRCVRRRSFRFGSRLRTVGGDVQLLEG